jgi:PadR family transcriptional regulator AphA
MDAVMPSRDSCSLSLTDWVVLGLVVEEPRHGFAVAQELRASSGLGKVWTVHRPLVYRAIDRLKELGFVTTGQTEPGRQGPDRRLLESTELGRRRLREWLDEPVNHPRDVRNHLLAKFVLRARLTLPLAPLAELQAERFAPLLRGIEETMADSNGPDRLIASWRLASMRTTQKFLEDVELDGSLS